jgi:hypothetical protein
MRKDDAHLWEKLCWEILYQFVPGFQFERRRGRPRKWNSAIERNLLESFEILIKGKTLSTRQACEFLARSKKYRGFGSAVNPPNWRTIHEHVKKARLARRTL